MSRLFTYPDVKTVIVCGDIHGNFRGIVHKLCIQYGCRDTLLIVAGDCGFGFEKFGYYEMIYTGLSGRLRKANNYIVFVRGNHDDPAYFAEERVGHARWRCVPDYSVLRACGHNILCIGGATSIDRMGRQEENERRRERGHVSTAAWWEDEVPVFRPEEIDAIPDDVCIDTVVTHTAPSFCEPSAAAKQGLKAWAAYDPPLLWDVDKERKTMDDIFKCIRNHGHPVKRWFYGHFHRSWCGERDGVLFTMLDIEEFKEVL